MESTAVWFALTIPPLFCLGILALVCATVTSVSRSGVQRPAQRYFVFRHLSEQFTVQAVIKCPWLITAVIADIEFLQLAAFPDLTVFLRE